MICARCGNAIEDWEVTYPLESNPSKEICEECWDVLCDEAFSVMTATKDREMTR